MIRVNHSAHRIEYQCARFQNNVLILDGRGDKYRGRSGRRKIHSYTILRNNRRAYVTYDSHLIHARNVLRQTGLIASREIRNLFNQNHMPRVIVH